MLSYEYLLRIFYFLLLSNHNCRALYHTTFRLLLHLCLKMKDAGDGKGTAKGLLDRIAELESEAERSLMHRFTTFLSI